MLCSPSRCAGSKVLWAIGRAYHPAAGLWPAFPQLQRRATGPAACGRPASCISADALLCSHTRTDVPALLLLNMTSLRVRPLAPLSRVNIYQGSAMYPPLCGGGAALPHTLARTGLTACLDRLWRPTRTTCAYCGPGGLPATAMRAAVDRQTPPIRPDRHRPSVDPAAAL